MFTLSCFTNELAIFVLLEEDWSMTKGKTDQIDKVVGTEQDNEQLVLFKRCWHISRSFGFSTFTKVQNISVVRGSTYHPNIQYTVTYCLKSFAPIVLSIRSSQDVRTSAYCKMIFCFGFRSCRPRQEPVPHLCCYTSTLTLKQISAMRGIWRFIRIWNSIFSVIQK